MGSHGWLDRWERNGWRTVTGNRVGHADIWKRIRKWFRLFERSPTRTVPEMNTMGLGHAFRQVEEKIASSILGVRGRAGARWNRMNLRNTDPLALKTVIMIVKS